MERDETELEMVRRHVQEGEGYLASQRVVIARLSMSGLPTEEAETLLATFEGTQSQHEDHLARLERRQD